MRKRDEGISSAWSFLGGTIILLIVVPGVLIGPARAVRIIGSTVSSTLLQNTQPPAAMAARVQERPTLPLVKVDEDLLEFEGLRYPVSIESDVITFNGEEAFPFGPYRKITIKEVKGNVEATSPLALWIAGRIGVPVIYQELVYAEIDGGSAEVAVISEAIDGSFEKYRNAAEVEVPVVTVDPFDLPAANVHGGAVKSFNKFSQVVIDTTMAAADMRSKLDTLLDVDAFLNLYAALEIAGARAGSNYRYALVQSPRTEKFYPVLTAAAIMPLANEGKDHMAERLLSIAEWRSRYDRKIAEGIELLRDDAALMKKLDDLSSGAAPVQAAVGGARRKLFASGADMAIVHSNAYEGSLYDRLRAHWERIRVPETMQAP